MATAAGSQWRLTPPLGLAAAWWHVCRACAKWRRDLLFPLFSFAGVGWQRRWLRPGVGGGRWEVSLGKQGLRGTDLPITFALSYIFLSSIPDPPFSMIWNTHVAGTSLGHTNRSGGAHAISRTMRITVKNIKNAVVQLDCDASETVCLFVCCLLPRPLCGHPTRGAAAARRAFLRQHWRRAGQRVRAACACPRARPKRRAPLRRGTLSVPRRAWPRSGASRRRWRLRSGS